MKHYWEKDKEKCTGKKENERKSWKRNWKKKKDWEGEAEEEEEGAGGRRRKKRALLQPLPMARQWMYLK